VTAAGIIAQKISASFSSLGISSFFVHATEAAHGDLGVITAEDVVIAISNSGNTPELIFIIPSLRVPFSLLRSACVHGANKAACFDVKVLAGKIIGITSNKDSLLARYSDASIITGKILEADQHKIAPTASTIVCLAIGDALAVTLSARMKFTLPEFGLRHPGMSTHHTSTLTSVSFDE
jgi:arabinose-5-phosphate isomerase